MYKNIWPGFTYGVGAFVLYCVGEKVLGSEHKGHDEHNEH
jgi:glycerol kinase